MKPLIIIIGPTAVGKSALGIELAHRLNGEIISGDSVQVYQKLNIGSAKPTLAERQGIRHHLLDFLDPAEAFTVARFQVLAQAAIAEIQADGKIPVMVGGTGLYIRSILDGFAFAEEGSAAVKDKWLRFAKEHGQAALHRELEKVDPVSAGRLHSNDTARIIRALEVYELTGAPLSGQREYSEQTYRPLDRSVVYVGLTAPRALIYERINLRCEQMIAAGLLQETQALLDEGYPPTLKGLQSIGYRHSVDYLYGKTTRTEMLRLFQRDTRHFAKRQLTWFRRDPRIMWYDITQSKFDEIIENIVQTVSAPDLQRFPNSCKIIE